MSDQTKLALLSDSLVSDTVRSAGAAKSFAVGGKVSLRKRPRMKVDRTHDDPYLAGESQNHRCLYIDKRVPKTMTVKGKTFDPAKYLAIHESNERKHMDAGMKYEPAHRLALKAERKAVEADGINWAGYQEQMHKLAAITQHEGTARLHPPTDLFKGPFPRREKALLRAHGDRAPEGVRSFVGGGSTTPEDEDSGPSAEDIQAAGEEHGPWEDKAEEHGPWKNMDLGRTRRNTARQSKLQSAWPRVFSRDWGRSRLWQWARVAAHKRARLSELRLLRDRGQWWVVSWEDWAEQR